MAGSGIKEKLGVDEITRGIWKVLLAEFLGNLLLNFYGCASCVGTGNEKSAVLVALTFGLVIMAIVQVRISLYNQLATRGQIRLQ
jgi:aquaporin related protein